MAHVAVTTPALHCLWLGKVCGREGGGEGARASFHLPTIHTKTAEKPFDHVRHDSGFGFSASLSVTQQTPVLACSLGYFSDPLILTDNLKYLGHLVDAVLFTQPLKPFPKAILPASVHEGLLHCTLQTPILACRLRHFANFFGSPLLHSFTRSSFSTTPRPPPGETDPATPTCRRRSQHTWKYVPQESEAPVPLSNTQRL